MLRPLAGVLAGLMLLLAPGTASAKAPKGHQSRNGPPIRQVVSFGDSWSSANAIYGTRPGPAWPQLLASKYGDVQKADTEGGLNFARGGAFITPIAPYSNAESPTPVTAQIDDYLGKYKRFSPGQLVTIWAGGNDLFAYAGAWSEATLDAFCHGTQTPAD